MRPWVIAAGLLLYSCAAPPQETARIVGYTYQVVHTYPHDSAAFTQGLLFLDGFLYEGTGLPGRSSIRKVKLETGEVVQQRDVPAPHFGEGIAVWKDRLVELTWQSEKGFLYDLATFEPKREFPYPGEGWGLTCDGQRFIMSDGSAQLRFLDPVTMLETSRITVNDDAGSVSQLNELEWVKGEIWANVWKQERIVRIDPKTGNVTGRIDLRGLLPLAQRPDPDAVLNGIAYDSQGGRIFVTGKLWPKLFEIRVIQQK